MKSNQLYFALLILFIQSNIHLTNQNNNWQQSKKECSGVEVSKKKSITYKIMSGINHTWGYDIYIDEKLKIHQPNIPGMSGNEGFKTKEDASKIAALVISKIKKGEMPPTVTTQELKKLNLLK